MAVTVQTGGTFTQAAGDRPGLYVRFVQQAINAIGTGVRSKVGIVKTNIGTAAPDQVYRITRLEDANTLFGDTNTDDIKWILTGGASEVVVSALALSTDEVTNPTDYPGALDRLATYDFNIFTQGIGAASALVSDAYTWLQTQRTDGKNFVSVFANTATETDAASIVQSAQAVQDEDSVFVANGVVDSSGNNIAADEYACYLAGVIANQSLSQSLTFYDVPFADVITRYVNADIKTLLAAGIIVTTMDGDQPKVEQGLTLGTAPFNKIRTVRAKQAMIDDINSAVKDSYIGKITNSPDGQLAVVNAIKAYLTTLANGNVIDPAFTVAVDNTADNSGSDLNINISVKFLDSIEYVYLTITY